MSAGNENENNISPPPQQRRKSFVELLTGRTTGDAQGSTSPNTPKPAGTSMASAMAQSAQQQTKSRRLSITTLGLSGSPPQPPTSPFGSLRRGYSVNDSGRRPSTDDNESALEEADMVSPPTGGSDGSPGANTFKRRVSFGGRTYKDIRIGSNGQAENGDSTTNGAPAVTPGSPPNRTREGFNWSENLRKRAERSSISASSGGTGFPLSAAHNRSKSTAQSTPPTPVAAPPAPVPAPVRKVPDHFQERILKGDFYMD